MCTAGARTSTTLDSVLFGDIEEDNTGFTEYKYGIGVYAPDKDEDVCYPESVIVFKKGYYD